MVPAVYEVVMLSLRVIAVLAALVFFYMAFFMYPDETGAWQNRLVDLWVGISSESQGSRSVQAALLKVSSSTVNSWLTWLLGQRLVSIQVAAVSISLSFASSMFILFLGGLHSWMNGEPPYPFSWLLLLIFGVGFSLFGLLGVRGLCERFKPPLTLAITVTMVVLAPAVGIYLTGWQSWMQGHNRLAVSALTAITLLAISAFGVLCDLLVLVANRLVLKSMATTDKLVILVLGCIYNCTCIVVLTDSTIFAFSGQVPWSIYKWTGTFIDEVLSLPIFGPFALAGKFEIVSFLALSSNLFTLLVSVAFLAIVTAALVHRMFWPVAERSVYALYQWKVFTNKPLQLSTAIALMLYAFPGLRAVVSLFRL